MASRGRSVRARFDDAAFAEDLARLSRTGLEACTRARTDFERDGIPIDRLRACEPAHDSGTDLPGSIKVYVPDPSGRWRIVFQIATDDNGSLLSYLACGVGHQPRGARAPTVYQLAHHRLHGTWPRRPAR